MNRHAAQTKIRELAPNHDKVRLTNHAKKRNPEKGKIPLTKLEIMSCLEHGNIVEGPYQDEHRIGWRFTVRRYVDDQKCEVAGVLVTEPDAYVLVITGYSVKPMTRKFSPSANGEDTDDYEEENDGDDDVSLH